MGIIASKRDDGECFFPERFGAFPFSTWGQLRTIPRVYLGVLRKMAPHPSVAGTPTNFLTSQFDCEVVRAHGLEDTLVELRQGDYPRAASSTTYAKHQDVAVAIGAERSFGKLEFDTKAALRLGPILGLAQNG